MGLASRMLGITSIASAFQNGKRDRTCLLEIAIPRMFPAHPLCQAPRSISATRTKHGQWHKEASVSYPLMLPRELLVLSSPAHSISVLNMMLRLTRLSPLNQV